MAVQVQLTFNSMDEALVALARLVDPAKVAAASAPVEKTPRQARSDAGKTRGPHKKDEQNAGAVAQPANAVSSGNGAGGATVTISSAAQTGTTDPKSTASAGASTSTTPAPVPPQPTPAPVAPTAVPTADDVQKAVEKLYAAKAYEGTLELLKSRFGVERGKDIPPAKWGEFIAKVDRVIAGEAI